jgi:vancomycin permeability regulator SanA
MRWFGQSRATTNEPSTTGPSTRGPSTTGPSTTLPGRRAGGIARFLIGSGLILCLAPWLGMRWVTRTARGSVESAPVNRVALVLGAGLYPDGTPTAVLMARITTAVDLLNAQKVDTLIMSGDNSRPQYDEVSAMKNAAVALGAPTDRVLLDYAGFRTLDSCVRLRKIFGQSRVTVVTQDFHLPRAVHLCRSAGIEAYGVAATDPPGTGWKIKSWLREVPASAQAWLDVHVLGTQPKFLGTVIDIDHPPKEALVQPLNAKA